MLKTSNFDQVESSQFSPFLHQRQPFTPIVNNSANKPSIKLVFTKKLGNQYQIKQNQPSQSEQIENARPKRNAAVKRYSNECFEFEQDSNDKDFENPIPKAKRGRKPVNQPKRVPPKLQNLKKRAFSRIKINKRRNHG